MALLSRPDVSNTEYSREANFRVKPDSSDSKDHSIFESVAMPHMAAVYTFAYSLVRETAQAEDLTQDTFLNAYKSFSKFKLGTNCKAWLFKICKNLFIDRFRQKKRRPVHQDVDTAAPVAKTSSREHALFEQHGIENEEIFLDLFGDEINRFLLELPSEFRKALMLCDLEGLSYDEISDLEDCPVGTVRSRISRARGFLRERLEVYALDLGYATQSGVDSESRLKPGATKLEKRNSNESDSNYFTPPESKSNHHNQDRSNTNKKRHLDCDENR